MGDGNHLWERDQQLRRRSGGRRAGGLRRVVRVLAVAALRVALASADGVRRQAHRMKGAGRTVGVCQVDARATYLETSASATVNETPGVVRQQGWVVQGCSFRRLLIR